MVGFLPAFAMGHPTGPSPEWWVPPVARDAVPDGRGDDCTPRLHRVSGVTGLTSGVHTSCVLDTCNGNDLLEGSPRPLGAPPARARLPQGPWAPVISRFPCA